MVVRSPMGRPAWPAPAVAPDQQRPPTHANLLGMNSKKLLLRKQPRKNDRDHRARPTDPCAPCAAGRADVAMDFVAHCGYSGRDTATTWDVRIFAMVDQFGGAMVSSASVVLGHDAVYARDSRELVSQGPIRYGGFYPVGQLDAGGSHWSFGFVDSKGLRFGIGSNHSTAVPYSYVDTPGGTPARHTCVGRTGTGAGNTAGASYTSASAPVAPTQPIAPSGTAGVSQPLPPPRAGSNGSNPPALSNPPPAHSSPTPAPPLPANYGGSPPPSSSGAPAQPYARTPLPSNTPQLPPQTPSSPPALKSIACATKPASVPATSPTISSLPAAKSITYTAAAAKPYTFTAAKPTSPGTYTFAAAKPYTFTAAKPTKPGTYTAAAAKPYTFTAAKPTKPGTYTFAAAKPYTFTAAKPPNPGTTTAAA
ncbi:MAG: hypothetical protein WDW38_003854 [Sanguina aurantia]